MNIVCLTSYGYRLQETAPTAIKSLITKDFAPDKIILYVAESDRHFIKNQFDRFPTVEIRYIDDYKSHKKFYGLTDRELDNDFIIIVDDDLNYKPYFWGKLWAKYEEHKSEQNFIVCNRGQLLFSHEKYLKTRFIMKTDPDNGQARFGSGAGLLIPPRTMRISKETLLTGFEISPHCDETFYSCLCAANGITTFCTGKPQPFNPLPLPQKDPNGLWDKFNKYEKDSVLIKCMDYFKLQEHKVTVSFTSWKKRIEYAADVVKRMRNQTIRPTQIILTLSADEFRNKEKDLPADLVNMQGGDFVIRWVRENSKTFKKLEPLFYLPANDWVLIVDDDILYSENFIEMMFASVNGNNPVTGSHLKTYYLNGFGNVLSANGAFTMIKPFHCLPYLKEIKDYAVRRGKIDLCSDPALTYATLLNGYKFSPTKQNLQPLQNQTNGKFPEPYSGGSIGKERNKETHNIILDYIKKGQK